MSPLRKQPRHTRPTRVLSTEETNALLEQLRPAKSNSYQFAKATRNYTLAVVMLETGLRVNELVNLTLEDLMHDVTPVTTLIVRPEIAKGGRERQIPVSTRLHHALAEMELRIWQPLLRMPHHWAFAHGPQWQQLTTRTIERIIKAAALKAIGVPITPHMLRHTFATRLLKKSNLRIVQMLLGHANIQTTQRYTHPNNQDLAQAISDAQE